MNFKLDLFIACDFKNRREFSDFLNKIENINDLENQGFKIFLKIGLELFISEGASVIAEAKERGFRIFLDLKLHDISNTMCKTVGVVSRFGVDYLTVHLAAGEEAIRKVVDTSASLNGPKILGVTVLTSLDENLIQGVLPDSPGCNFNKIENWVLKLTKNAIQWGCYGVVCSPREIQMIRKFNDQFPLIVPGIRWKNPTAQQEVLLDDQKRTMAPLDAIRLGANGIVIGRPITQSDDPLSVITLISRQFASVIQI